MDELKKLEGLSPEDVRRLGENGIVTLDDLWSCVSHDPDGGIKQVAHKTNVSHELLSGLLAVESLGRARRRGSAPAVVPHSFDHLMQRVGNLFIALTLLLIVAVASALLWRGVSVGGMFRQQVVVKNSAGLAAFRAIAADDIEIKSTLFAEAKTFNDLNAVVGRYPRTALPTGSTVRDSQLLPAHLGKELTGRRLVSLPVRPGSLPVTPPPLATVTILFFPRPHGDKTSPPISVHNAMLLRVDRQGDSVSILVALSAEEFEAAKSVLGISDVIISPLTGS